MQTFFDHVQAIFILFGLRCIMPLLFTLGAGYLLKRVSHRSKSKLNQALRT